MLGATASPHLSPPFLNSNPYSFQDRKQLLIKLQKSKSIKQAAPIHAHIIKNGNQNDPFILFELLRVCSRSCSIEYASKIFRNTSNPNVFLYTAFIDVFISSGAYGDGIRTYFQMVRDFILPDNYIIPLVLKACGSALDLNSGEQIHCQAMKLGLCSDRFVRLKLVELYGKCGEFSEAKTVFDEMPQRDVVGSTVMISCYLDHGLLHEAMDEFRLVSTKDNVCWTAMIDGLARNGEMNMALELFREMQREGVKPNEVTIVCVLSACAHLGALELGKWVHSYVDKYNIEVNHIVGSALVNMYSRCGDIDEAASLFEGLEARDVTTYNSMIVGYALNGKSIEAIKMFRRMIHEGIKPTSITFSAVLNACSHGGLVDIGFDIFESMETEYGIERRIEHYGCMVDLLGRVGRLQEAYDFIQRANIAPDNIIWGSLLSACRIHKKFELGERVAKILLQYGAADSGTYILLSNVYASLGKFKEAAQVRAKLREEGVQKEPGCSSIEVKNEIHEFLLGDIRHPEREAIYDKLKELNDMLKSEDYAPETDVISQDIEEHEKKWALSIHSERLAICYGLISTKPCTTIRVVKNLRVCNDCHSVIKLISKITQRRIVVRDRNRFHHFENGVCSCGDYW
ncbi:PREDICTED: putative pentatricopeptide repeat-containing protein At5g59200, chloroplastic [Nicotiana attenuata]|uniref:Pentatricopeptide repeat-containing protein, chloroplastic n=1 Tax=Nicotiana attenuata TaxID=49451 RepID=A0A1J6KSV1_NICAT|nr:PREDICTED: putative pentatricopeptide repeat-containing protein At5g59200, chloroplastic [Nicotiana attenuata]OIT25875.1 putative pentatricopeptide repeat-containing protein, chloroplastic [Nicotiana attenuata]